MPDGGQAETHASLCFPVTVATQGKHTQPIRLMPLGTAKPH